MSEQTLKGGLAMGRSRRLFTYTLSQRDFVAWKSAPQSTSGVHKHIKNQARKRAVSVGRNVALILAPSGVLLEEVIW